MTETAQITDEQLLDLYLTGWVAGAFDVTLKSVEPTSRDHIVGCKACTESAIEFYKAHVISTLEDPAARAEVIDMFRVVLAGEQRDPKFITVQPAGRS